MSLIKLSMKTAIVGAVVGAAGLLCFGSDLASYVKTGSRMVRGAVSDAVPIQVELQRARDAVEDLLPEIHANVRLIAQEEVEIEGLKASIDRGEASLADQRTKIAKLRDALTSREASFTFGNLKFSREAVKADLARRFEKVRNGDIVLNGKRHLLERRQQSLSAATRCLEEMRAARLDLQEQVEALESQHRLVQAAATHSTLKVDRSKTNDARRIITQIKKRLDVAERLLEKEQIFVESIPVNGIDETDLVSQVDEYLHGQKEDGTLSSDTLSAAVN